ncbi:uncharacterized protein [Onthophagus taurus]|uniref:uncharacterized protein n=1 Tax=Onthophagus taurus TaxID=166361 RepID=UPI0039BDD265
MTTGRIEEFDVRNGNWTSYIARERQFFKANEIKQELETAMLITVMGVESFDILTDLCSKKPEDEKFEDLVVKMEKHFNPKPSEIAEHYKFRRTVQEPEENITNFMVKLKKFAKNCNFGAQLEENLRDQIVFGLKSEIIRQRLFSEATLTYDTACTLAIGMESAAINAGFVMGSTTQMNKFQVVGRHQQEVKPGKSSTQDSSTRGKRCKHCGKDNHSAANCFFREAKCHT